MIGILGEDDSDALTLKCLVKRLLRNERASIKPKGFGSQGELLKKGANHIATMRNLGCTHFVVCADADGHNPAPIREKLFAKIIQTAGLSNEACCVVPVQEIEAWILADLRAVTNVFSSWKPNETFAQPETVPSPKERLKRLSHAFNRKPRYDHVTHNEKVAAHLNIEVVYNACPSFQILADFIRPLAS